MGMRWGPLGRDEEEDASVESCLDEEEAVVDEDVDGLLSDFELKACVRDALCWPLEAAVCAYAPALDELVNVFNRFDVAVARAVGESWGGVEDCCQEPLPYTYGVVEAWFKEEMVGDMNEDDFWLFGDGSGEYPLDTLTGDNGVGPERYDDCFEDKYELDEALELLFKPGDESDEEDVDRK
jgi:hypothetical protein